MILKRFFILFVCLFLITPFFAVKALEPLKKTLENELFDAGKEAGYQAVIADPQMELYKTISSVISLVLGFIGTIFLILIIWSGFQWMMAGGNSDAIGEAKGRIVNATIGLAIILAAYVIVYYVSRQLIGATGINTY